MLEFDRQVNQILFESITGKREFHLKLHRGDPRSKKNVILKPYITCMVGYFPSGNIRYFKNDYNSTIDRIKKENNPAWSSLPIALINHRLDEPAVENLEKCRKDFWVNNEKMNEEEYWSHPLVLAFQKNRK